MTNSPLSAGGKRTSADTEDSSRKRARRDDKGDDYNPYLAHMYADGQDSNGAAGDGLPPGSALAHMKRRETTAKQAAKAEDGDTNPFTNKPHSQKYFRILDGRRDLPVHKQR